MSKPLDPTVVEILKRYELDPKQALWDCHGVWIMYHRHLERVAAKAGIVFMDPVILASGPEHIAMLITGSLGDQEEWSIGEASPQNNKNAYPWAMAEKRGKDRLILKLIGLHGFIYSEEEADDFKASKPAEPPPTPEADQVELEYAKLFDTINTTSIWDRKKVLEWWNHPKSAEQRKRVGLTKEMISELKSCIATLYPADEKTTDTDASPKT